MGFPNVMVLTDSRPSEAYLFVCCCSISALFSLRVHTNTNQFEKQKQNEIKYNENKADCVTGSITFISKAALVGVINTNINLL